MTPEKHLEDARRNASYGISLSLIMMPMMSIVLVSFKLLGFPKVPLIFSFAIATLMIFVVLNPVKKKLDGIQLSEIEENDQTVQRKLSVQYHLVVLFLVSLMLLCMYLIALLYSKFK